MRAQQRLCFLELRFQEVQFQQNPGERRLPTRASLCAGRRRPCGCKLTATTSPLLSLSPAPEPEGEEETCRRRYFLYSIAPNGKLKSATGPPEQSPFLSPRGAAAALPSSLEREAPWVLPLSPWLRRPPPSPGERRRPTDESGGGSHRRKTTEVTLAKRHIGEKIQSCHIAEKTQLRGCHIAEYLVFNQEEEETGWGNVNPPPPNKQLPMVYNYFSQQKTAFTALTYLTTYARRMVRPLRSCWAGLGSISCEKKITIVYSFRSLQIKFEKLLPPPPPGRGPATGKNPSLQFPFLFWRCDKVGYFCQCDCSGFRRCGFYGQ